MTANMYIMKIFKMVVEKGTQFRTSGGERARSHRLVPSAEIAKFAFFGLEFYMN